MAKNKRAIPVLGNVITELRQAKGWNVEYLAAKAAVSVKTIESAERSEDKFAGTIKRIATALGSNVVTLCTGVPPSQYEQPVVVEITAKVSVHPHQMPTEVAENILKALEKLIAAAGALVPITVKTGSIIITCKTQIQDALRLIAARRRGLLDSLAITKVQMLQQLTESMYSGHPLGEFGEQIFNRSLAGDSPETIAEDFDIDQLLVEGILAYSPFEDGPWTFSKLPTDEGGTVRRLPPKDERHQ